MITNGAIRYLKRIRTADYSHDEASADVSFVVPDGQDGTYAAAEARSLAVNEVFRALGLLSDAATVAAPETPPPPAQPATVKRERKVAVKDPLASPEPSSPATDGGHGQTTGGDLPPVSDSDLTSFVARRNDELIAAFAQKNGGDGRAGTALLRDCIAEYSASTPASVRGIPAEKRYAFMDAAKKLNVGEMASADI